MGVVLNVDDDIHMHVLQYVFLPRINVSVNTFVMGWNAHPMRTFVNGMMDITIDINPKFLIGITQHNSEV